MLERVRAEVEKVHTETTRLEESHQTDEEGIAHRAQEIESTDTLVGELAREIKDKNTHFITKTKKLKKHHKIHNQITKNRTHIIKNLQKIKKNPLTKQNSTTNPHNSSTNTKYN